MTRKLLWVLGILAAVLVFGPWILARWGVLGAGKLTTWLSGQVQDPKPPAQAARPPAGAIPMQPVKGADGTSSWTRFVDIRSSWAWAEGVPSPLLAGDKWTSPKQGATLGVGPLMLVAIVSGGKMVWYELDTDGHSYAGGYAP
jgi:hypothetical protein